MIHKEVQKLALPCEIIVDSRATTASPRDKASETSGEIFINPPKKPSLPPYRKIKTHKQK
jgi:hypothetical protein